MNILYLCHRFPFPPKRGGKIRPFNMIRHLTASGHAVTVCSLARSPAEAEEGRASRRIAPPSRWARCSEPLQIARMVVRLPLTTPSSMGYFYSPELARAGARSCWPTQRWDLIFVHCSSVAQYVEHVHRRARRSSTSATWTRRSGSSTRTTSRSRCRWATRSKAARCWRPRSAWRAASTCAPPPPAPSGETLQRLRHRRRRPTGSPTASMPASSAPTDGALRRRHHQLHRPHGLLPEPGVHGALLRAGLAAAAGAAAGA